jgi:phosphoglycerate dehydrogenase-like enzyme
VKLLILHNRPTDFFDLITDTCPHDELRWVDDVARIESEADEFQPEAVFSIKHSEFPGHMHRPALVTPSVKWFHVGGSGTEHLGEWDSARVTVTNAAGVLAPFHAEAAMSGLLALSTGLLNQRTAQLNRSWAPRRFLALADRTLLIVGLGHTGAALARLAKAFGMVVIGVRESGVEHPDVDEMHRPEDLPRLLPRADVLSLNLRSTPQTYHLFDDAMLRLAPRGCLLLNGARGPIVDTDALIAALASGHLGGAWLDVFDPEPLEVGSPLWSMDNVIVSAHCADQVTDFPRRFAVHFLTNLGRYRDGRPLHNLVHPPTL